jgi:hypothetical protein
VRYGGKTNSYRYSPAWFPGYKHRDHGGWYWNGHAVDWLGNGRARDENVDFPFEGKSLRLGLHLGRGRRCHYILTRISQGRCTKRQRD